MAYPTSEPLVEIALKGGMSPSITVGSEPSGFGGFDFTTSLSLPFSMLSSQLLILLSNRPIVLAEGILKQELRITDLKIESEEDRLNLFVAFKGSFKGTMVLKGKPVYNRANQTLMLEDLTYKMSTGNILVKTASWLLESQIRKRLESSARIALRSYFFKIAESIESGLNKPWGKNIKARGSVENFSISSFELKESSLIAVISCSGKISLALSDDLIPI